jgi:transcription antitermination factor NusG
MHVKTPNVSILVPKGTPVPPAQSAKLSTTNQNVHAPMDTLDPPLQTVDHHQNLNARPILNALITLHVYKKSVKIHVILILVVEMQNARQKIIEQYVFVSMDMLEIRTLSVKNVR